MARRCVSVPRAEAGGSLTLCSISSVAIVPLATDVWWGPPMLTGVSLAIDMLYFNAGPVWVPFLAFQDDANTGTVEWTFASSSRSSA